MNKQTRERVVLVAQWKGLQGEETEHVASVSAADFPSVFLEVFNLMADVYVYHWVS